MTSRLRLYSARFMNCAIRAYALSRFTVCATASNAARVGALACTLLALSAAPRLHRSARVHYAHLDAPTTAVKAATAKAT
jgi:hypothetical protein